LREPLKPIVPADDQAMVLPCASVMVIIVLLNAGVHMRDAGGDVLALAAADARAVASLPFNLSVISNACQRLR
jgi:hypothetical protein